MESLLCLETSCTEGPFAQPDPTLLFDSRVLSNLMSLQCATMPTQNYLTHIQTDVQPYMRKVVATWMLEVCEEQGCEDQVFGVAVNILDRFLCTTLVQRTQLQLIGAVCLLLASKWRQYRSLSVELLSYYSDYSISHEEIRKWELVILSKLGWDLSSVTAGDFLDHLLQRVPGAPKNNLVRRHSSTFVALAATEPAFVQVEPSSIAIAAVTVAIRGLRFPWRDSLVNFATETRSDLCELERVIKLLEDTIERESTTPPDQQSQSQPSQTQPLTSSSSSPSPTTTPSTKHLSQSNDFFDGNETPTDISDIMF